MNHSERFQLNASSPDETTKPDFDRLFPWPAKINLYQLAGQSVSGRLDIRHLPRLSGETECRDRSVLLTMAVQLDKIGRCQVFGSYSLNVTAICQRCLQPMELLLQDHFNWYAINDIEENSSLSETMEPVLAPKGRLNLIDALEDTLLLAMPISSRHTNPVCKAGDPRAVPSQSA